MSHPGAPNLGFNKFGGEGINKMKDHERDRDFYFGELFVF